MRLDSLLGKFKGKSGNIITFILIGILLLIVAMPVKKNSVYDSVTTDGTGEAYSRSEDTDIAGYDNYAEYYESRLKEILEKSYGEGTMNVMVSLSKTGDDGYIGRYDSSYNYERSVDGVLIVADIDDASAIADISFAVCALFDLPAHKVAVIIKN
ncbi:MAG: hypothetical protein IJV15_12515 [Lachnospiraceae bacterium]|nr:hypothetical protein [Lachnospiraceae bacterium]